MRSAALPEDGRGRPPILRAWPKPNHQRLEVRQYLPIPTALRDAKTRLMTKFLQGFERVTRVRVYLKPFGTPWPQELAPEKTCLSPCSLSSLFQQHSRQADRPWGQTSEDYKTTSPKNNQNLIRYPQITAIPRDGGGGMTTPKKERGGGRKKTPKMGDLNKMLELISA